MIAMCKTLYDVSRRTAWASHSPTKTCPVGTTCSTNVSFVACGLVIHTLTLGGHPAGFRAFYALCRDGKLGVSAVEIFKLHEVSSESALTIVVIAVLGLLGAGAYSADAFIYGRRRIELPWP